MKKGLSSIVDASHNFERVDMEASCLSMGVYVEHMYVK